MWTYMAYGPFASFAEYRAWMEQACRGEDPLFHAIRDKRTGRAGGVASYLRIDPPFGVIEIGHIALSPALQDNAASTEAMYLMMARVFDELGYRRYEWKCDALNEPSRSAAERLGFTFEGIFRQATMYKGRNRDTAWYAVIDEEWPALKAAYLTLARSREFRCERPPTRVPAAAHRGGAKALVGADGSSAAAIKIWELMASFFRAFREHPTHARAGLVAA